MKNQKTFCNSYLIPTQSGVQPNNERDARAPPWQDHLKCSVALNHTEGDIMSSLASIEKSDVASQSNLEKLESRLQAQLRGRIRDLSLTLHGDGLVLRGSAHTYHAKQLAQHAVMRQADLPILANEIEVS